MISTKVSNNVPISQCKCYFFSTEFKKLMLDIKRIQDDTSSLKKEHEKLMSTVSVAGEKVDRFPEEMATKYDEKIKEVTNDIAKIHSQKQNDVTGWQQVGLNIRLVEEICNKNHDEANANTIGGIPPGTYVIEFTNLDHQEPYSFTVSISSEIKIVASDPKDLIYYNEALEIEKKFASNPYDLIYLAVLLRNHIMRRSNKMY